MLKIAVDGPAGAGKSTISRAVAKRMNFIYIDTGAMYRAAALACLDAGIDITGQPKSAAELVSSSEIDLENVTGGSPRVLLNGTDVSELIRTPRVSAAASAVSAIPAVRLILVDKQREMSKRHNVIMDGRDIGTYVLPDAQVKIFLTADARERARRRYDELCEKGESVSLDEVFADMTERDKNDSTRAFAPLKAAEDSIIVDTTGLSLEQSTERLYKIISERLGL